jgi:hypothetical protein
MADVLRGPATPYYEVFGLDVSVYVVPGVHNLQSTKQLVRYH